MSPLQGCIGFSAGISINMLLLQGLICLYSCFYKHVAPLGLSTDNYIPYSKVQKHLNTIGFDTSPPLARFPNLANSLVSI